MTGARGLAGLLALLLIVCSGLIWVIYQQLQASPHPATRTMGQAAAEIVLPPLPTPEPFALAAIDSMEQVIERPLFSQSRRPPSEEVAVIETAPASQLDLTLRGIVFADKGGVALLRPPEGTQVLRLRQGERYQGWTLTTLEPQAVVFERDEESVTLRLDFDVRSDRAAEPRRPNDLGKAIARRKEQLRSTQEALERQLEQQEEELEAERERLQELEEQLDQQGGGD